MSSEEKDTLPLGERIPDPVETRYRASFPDFAGGHSLEKK
jgi:hypothetical protein